MSGEAIETSSGGSAAPGGLSETLSDAERAYFSSRGTDTAGLEAQYGPKPAADAGKATDSGTPPAQTGEKAPAGDEDEDGAITIGADGRPRETLSGKYVPHAALHKERSRRQAIEGELATFKEKQARAEERLAILTEMMNSGDQSAGKTAAAKPGAKSDDADLFAENAIDPEEDVFGALRQSQRKVDALVKKLADRDKVTEAKEQSQGIAQSYVSDVKTFARENADFGDAYNHLIANMHQELEAMGVEDEATRNKLISEREKTFVSEILERKGSPAAALYKLAKVRGYAGKAVPAAAPANGAKAPDAKAVEKLTAINKAKETVVSLGNSGGSAGGEALTMEALANMSEAEFAATARRLGKSGMARVMGG